jgi:hypothetical protein
MMNNELQYGPYPYELEALVNSLTYRPGWSFDLKIMERDPADTHGQAAGGLTFVVHTGHATGSHSAHYEGTMDAYHEGAARPIYHYFPVPAATYNEASWRRWLFDCLLKVETHECMEHFQINDQRPYGPTHGPGDDPYSIHEYTTDERRRTSFRGTVKESPNEAAHRIAVMLTPGAD